MKHPKKPVNATAPISASGQNGKTISHDFDRAASGQDQPRGSQAVTLSHAEQVRMRQLNDELGRLKLALADAALQVAKINGCGGTMGQIVEAIQGKDKQMVDEVRAMARAHQIDPDSSMVNLELDTMILTATPGAPPSPA